VAPHFAGREAALAELDSLLPEGPDGAVTVITAVGGMAGVGKTALATRWAHRVADQFPDGQLYVNLRGFDPLGAPVEPAAAARQPVVLGPGDQPDPADRAGRGRGARLVCAELREGLDALETGDVAISVHQVNDLLRHAVQDLEHGDRLGPGLRAER
jgi:hypothetical protein